MRQALRDGRSVGRTVSQNIRTMIFEGGKRGQPQSKQYVKQVVLSAFAQSGLKGSASIELRGATKTAPKWESIPCCPAGPPLRLIVRTCIHRELASYEEKSLVARCRDLQEFISHDDRLQERKRKSPFSGTFAVLPAAGDVFSLEAIAEALYEWQMLAQDPHVAECRVLTWRDFCFATCHNGLGKRDVLRSMERSRRIFYRTNVLTITVAAVLFLTTLVEYIHVGYFDGALNVSVCSGMLVLLAFVGVIGARRLHRDLMIDDDGKETPSQRMLECYFWSAGAIMIYLGITVLNDFLLDNDAGKIRDLSRTDPALFQQLAGKLGVGASYGAEAVSKLTDRILVLKSIFAALALALCMVTSLALRMVVRIVTLFEIVQGMLNHLALLSLIVALLLVYGSVALQVMLANAISDVVRTVDCGNFDALTSQVHNALWIPIGLGALMAPIAILGCSAASFESPRLLNAYSHCAIAQAALLAAVGACSIIIGNAWDDVQLFVSRFCAEVRHVTKSACLHLAPIDHCRRLFVIAFCAADFADYASLLASRDHHASPRIHGTRSILQQVLRI